MQGAVHLVHCSNKGGYDAGRRLTFKLSEEYGQQAVAEDNTSSFVDLRYNLEASRLESGTATNTHGELENMQDGNETVPSSTEGGQQMRGEEIGEGD